MSSAGALIRGFDPSHKKFCCVSTDNRINIWDVAAGTIERELVESKHLTFNYTCLCWATLGTSTVSASKTTQLLLALGTERGEIVVWNVTTGELRHRLDQTKGGHTSRVNDIVSSKNELFSCSEDGSICQWNIQSGQLLWNSKKSSTKQAVKRLCLTPEGTVLASGTTEVKLWDLSSKKTLKTFVGSHRTPISSMKFSGDGKYLITASSDRSVYLWDCVDADVKSTVQAFNCDSDPVWIEFNHFINSAFYHILVLTESDKVNLWSFLPENVKKSKSKTLTPSGTISGFPMLSAQFFNATQVILTIGNITKPVFQHLDYLSSTGEIQQQQTIQLDTNRVTNRSASEQGPKSIKKVAAKSVSEINMPIPDAQLLEQPSVDQQQQELTLQERLEALGFSSATTEEKGAVPKVNSMQAVLTQALHTKDNRLLETCLNVSDPTVIRNTVKKLPSTYVISFLTIMVEKFQAKPSRVELIPWIKAILVNHSSYLMVVPDLAKSLSGLYAAIDSRLSAFPHLLKLSGRLDLLLSQVTSIGDSTDFNPMTVYEEHSEDEDAETNDVNDFNDVDNGEEEEQIMEEETTEAMDFDEEDE